MGVLIWNRFKSANRIAIEQLLSSHILLYYNVMEEGLE